MRKSVGVVYGAAVAVVAVGLVGWRFAAPNASDSAPEVSASALPSATAEPWGASGTKAKMPDGESLTTAVSDAVTGHPGTYAVSVVDVATGKQLVDLGGADPGTPASSLKLLTGTAALAELGHGTRFPTTASLEGDTVWLVGGGDVLLSAGKSDPDATNGHAGLGTLAKKTVAALVKRGVTGQVKIGLDSSLFPGPGLNPDWADDLVTTNNITEVQTPAMYAGRGAADHHAEILRNPAAQARASFVQRLKEQATESGADLTFTVGGKRDGSDQEDSTGKGTVLAKVESSTVLEQLEYMENHSDNYLAETYGRLVAVDRGKPGTIKGATSSVSDVVKGLGVDTAGLDMRDTSGLAATNQVSPSTLAQLLAVTQTSSNPDLRELAPLLPSSGFSGTLAQRLAGPESKALVRAKTGTLADVISLSGLVTTEQGRLLSFSVMSSGVKGHQDEAREATDAVAEALLKG